MKLFIHRIELPKVKHEHLKRTISVLTVSGGVMHFIPTGIANYDVICFVLAGLLAIHDPFIIYHTEESENDPA